MKNFIFFLVLVIGTAIFFGCGQVAESPTGNDIPFPSKNVVFQLNDLSSSSIGILEEYTRARGLVSSAYAQAGIDLGYFEGFDPVLSTFRDQTLTSIATNEFTFQDTYSTGESGIPFKGQINKISDDQYIVWVWGIRPEESSYRRWLYGDLVNTLKGSIIIDPYIMWTSTHDYPMTIKFEYDATETGTKVCTGGATGKWSASSEIIGSTYFYCKEDNSDTSNTIVTFQMYQNTTNETTGIGIIDMLYGKFNRDTERLHGRDWTDGYAESDSGLLYVNTETYATIEGTVPSNVDASGMTFPSTPEAGFAAFPDSFPTTPTF